MKNDVNNNLVNHSDPFTKSCQLQKPTLLILGICFEHTLFTTVLEGVGVCYKIPWLTHPT